MFSLFITSASRQAVTQWLQAVVLGMMLVLFMGGAQAQDNAARFDHLKTGFALNGMHSTLKCDSCHTNGVFKGTPRDCQTCHSSGTRFSRANVVMPATHIPTRQSCETCHNTQTFTGARFSHSGVLPGSCQTCHDGMRSQGKPAGHVVTRAACDSCHVTNTWSGAKPDHKAFNVTTNCQSCHNGSAATGKPGNHIPVTANCISCHNVNIWRPTSWNHTQVRVTSACSSCHSGAFPPANGRPGNHIPYQGLTAVAISNCDTCHKAGFASWNPGAFHANVTVTNQCATCHLSAAYGLTSKPANPTHSAVTGGCESCHNSSSWAGAKVDHSKFTASTQCVTCHNGSTATGKPGNHIPTTANCNTCHKSGYTSWNPGRFHANVTVTSQCSNCHLTSAYGLTSKPTNATHSAVTGGCESCHNTSGWSGARVDHSRFTVATQCTTCHNGSTATGKPGSHIPVTANCVSCHNVNAWLPTSWNHTQVTVTRACSNCHSGAFPPADGRPANHIPYQALTGTTISNCDSCHKAGYSTWSPGLFHANVTMTGQCSTCHLSTAYGLTAKPSNAVHAGIVNNCETCHKSTASWNSVTFAHSPSNAVGTGTCDSCHNGSTATGKPAAHIPILVAAVKCDSCHKSQMAWLTSMKTNHTAVVAQGCKTCHNASYASKGAKAKPANHIPESQLLNGSAMDCNACHSNTNPGGFGVAVMNHNSSQGNGSGWCYACHNSGTNFLGNMERMALQHRRPSPAATDCSQSGCHRPLGNKGSTYRNWD